MRSDSADQKKDRHGMVTMYILCSSCDFMLYISMETGPATLSPVAEVEPCSTSAFWSRRPPATPCDSTATGRGAVVGRWSLRFWYCESAFRWCTCMCRALVRLRGTQRLSSAHPPSALPRSYARCGVLHSIVHGRVCSFLLLRSHISHRSLFSLPLGGAQRDALYLCQIASVM